MGHSGKQNPAQPSFILSNKNGHHAKAASQGSEIQQIPSQMI